jgi:MerR family transcriptional regulator, redox-sensitive transcriptional activator SoxR
MAELTVGEVAQRSGVAVSALHFYEAKGLIKSRRSTGNQRRYERGVLRRVAVIRTAQRVGISLEQIAAALDSLPQRQAPTRADWSRLSRLWRDDLNQRIAQLEKLRDTLDDCSAAPCATPVMRWRDRGRGRIACRSKPRVEAVIVAPCDPTLPIFPSPPSPSTTACAFCIWTRHGCRVRC